MKNLRIQLDKCDLCGQVYSHAKKLGYKWPLQESRVVGYDVVFSDFEERLCDYLYLYSSGNMSMGFDVHRDSCITFATNDNEYISISDFLKI